LVECACACDGKLEEDPKFAKLAKAIDVVTLDNLTHYYKMWV
jgi:hypothetical protein